RRAAANEGGMDHYQRTARRKKRSTGETRGDCRHVFVAQRTRAARNARVLGAAPRFSGAGDGPCAKESGGARPPTGCTNYLYAPRCGRRLVRGCARPCNRIGRNFMHTAGGGEERLCPSR